eukprot:4810234-Pyramimonas_sp.AAC.1
MAGGSAAPTAEHQPSCRPPASARAMDREPQRPARHPPPPRPRRRPPPCRAAPCPRLLLGLVRAGGAAAAGRR